MTASSTSRTTCVFPSVRHLLDLSQELASKALKDRTTGEYLDANTVWSLATIARASGKEVLPIGCDNHDAMGYCLGHPVAPPDDAAEGQPGPQTDCTR